MLRRLAHGLTLWCACAGLAHAAVPGCAGDSRITGCHALVQTPNGMQTDVALSYVIAPGLGYVQPRIERAGAGVVRVYFIDSDYATASPREIRTLHLGRFAAGQYHVEIYEGNDGLLPPPQQPEPPQRIALLGLAVPGTPFDVPATDPATLLAIACVLAAVGRRALRAA